MTNTFIVAATLALIGAGGHFPGAAIGGSTGIGSGLGRQGTGPGYSNGINSLPQPLTHSAPPGGYGYAPPTQGYPGSVGLKGLP